MISTSETSHSSRRRRLAPGTSIRGRSVTTGPCIAETLAPQGGLRAAQRPGAGVGDRPADGDRRLLERLLALHRPSPDCADAERAAERDAPLECGEHADVTAGHHQHYGPSEIDRA